MNHVNLIGRITKDIELRYTQGTQTAVTKFSIAVTRKFKKDEADFISCIAWGKTAELMSKYVRKGDKIGINGRLETGSYENKDKVKVYTTDVIVEELEFLEKKHENDNRNVDNSKPVAADEDDLGAEFSPYDPNEDENLPF